MGAFLLAADAPDPAAGQGPVVIVVLAVITLLGTVLTALGPSLIEALKARRIAANPPPVPPPTPEPAPASSQMANSAQSGLSMVEAAVADYRSQRDLAMSRYDRALQALEQAQEIIRRQSVYIAQLESQANGQPRPSPTTRQGQNP